MNVEPLRRTLIVLAIAAALVASVVYDSYYVQTNAEFQVPIAGLIAVSFAAVFVLQQYPERTVQGVLLAGWPLHLFTLVFFWACFAIHRGSGIGQFVSYTVFAYATYLLVPLVFLLDHRQFVAFVKAVAVVSALLAVPSFVGAAGIESFLGIPLRVKFSYAQFSGIAASAGLFEHAEGHAFQMAIGMFCSWYAWRRTGNLGYIACLLLSCGGLVVAQGRAAIFGVALAGLFIVLPRLFRRSFPLLAVTTTLVLIAPYLVLTQLAALPGISGYFRLERGLSGRGEAWRYAIDLIEEKPWTGHGFLASSKLTEDQKKELRKSGFSGAGTTFHNTYLSKAVDLGLIVTAVYCLLYLVPFIHVCRPTSFPLEQTLVRSMLLLTLTTSIYRDYNIGGIRSTAMIGAIFFGIANLWPWVHAWREAVPAVERRTWMADGTLGGQWRTEPLS